MGGVIAFTRSDLIRSRIALERGIDNTPPTLLLLNLDWTCAGLDRVRAALKVDLEIESGYRCALLNILVGGSQTSQHKKAEAVDFKAPQFGDPQEIAQYLSPLRYILGIDQLILEPTWVHVSFTHSPRGQVLRKLPSGGYLEGLS